VLEAVIQAQTYINQGNSIVAEVDIHSFFDEIPLEKLMSILSGIISDEKVLGLIKSYLYCRIYDGSQIVNKTKGLVQGNSISPVLSNLYLDTFDRWMEEQGFNWIRFADNIYVFTDSDSVANNIFNDITAKLTQEYLLPINEKKSGVYEAVARRILGYEFYKKGKSIEVTLLKQCTLYLDEKEHLRMAKLMEIASLHNIRANLRYYNKKKSNKMIEEAVTYISQCINEINESTTNDGLLLTEARARQTYYRTFNSILSNTDFGFSARSRRPPLDPLNAMISFGNTLLYNKFLQIIWKTSLDPRFGVIHAANNRAHSLNLDFADIFKPILVDRIIFSLVNMKQLQIDADFETRKDGAVYLSKSGKKQFIEHFNQKLADTLVIKGSRMTYQQLIRNEVYNYQRYVTDGEKYKPYKYY
jgi:CRISPR-associated protein Cas1